MRILINASVAGHVENGLLVYSREMLKELLPLARNAGHEVSLLIPRGSILEEMDVEKVYLPAICGAQRKRSLLSPVCRLVYNLFVLPLVARKFDVVYSTTPHGALWGCTPQILTLHDLNALQFPRQHRFQYWYMRLCLPLLLRHSRKIVSISNTTKDLLAKDFGVAEGKMSVVYNGCSEGFRPIDGAATRVELKYGVRDYILACGVSFPHKNIRFLVENYANLPQALRLKHPLAVVGVNTDSYAQSLMQYAATLPCAGAIKFLGMVPSEDLAAIYSAARVLVFPTLAEGFGMPPIEALRCGTPCLVSNLQILRETLDMPDERYFDPVDGASLVACLTGELARTKDVPSEIRERIKTFSWKSAAEQVYGILSRIMV